MYANRGLLTHIKQHGEKHLISNLKL